MHAPLLELLWPARAARAGFVGKGPYSTETNFVHSTFWDRFTNHLKAQRGAGQSQPGICVTEQVSGSETTNTTSNFNHTKGFGGHQVVPFVLGAALQRRAAHNV